MAELCQNSCKQNPWLFEACWDKVFTELEVKGSDGLLRIDRLMLNTTDKQALIVDYKSGQISDPMQLEDYRYALQKLSIIKPYGISIQFLRIGQ